ncbi:MAG TPA: FlgD immunoglobulin-like domain containing protein [Candidatus Cloacimonadota bacterium]|nr:FlgD immunoglobulin-like domain containing protein [Candidatus Cloacimonadota bacterium]
MNKKTVLQLIIITLITLFIPSLYADHFNNVWTGNGFQHMNFYLTSAQINGVNLEANDEIAVFDETYCVGRITLSAPIGSYLPFVASCDDPTTPAVDGYRSGNPVIFKIWDSSAATEFSEPALNIVYLSGNPVFQIGASAVVQLNYSAVPLYNLVLSVSPELAGTVTGYGAYEADTSVSISVTPAENYRFINWTDANNQIVSTSNPYVFNMPVSNLHYTANLEYHVNQAPQLLFPPFIEINEDTPYNISFEPYMSDPDNSLAELTLSGVSGTNINVQVQGHNVLFTPAPNWNGQEDITFTLSDNMGRAIDTEVLQVNVEAVNDAPYLIQSMPLVIFDEDTIFNGYSLLTVFGDEDLPYGDNLTFTAEGTPEFVVNIADDLFTISAPANWFGIGAVTFTATDNASEQISTVLPVRVEGVPDAPVINSWVPVELQVNINAGETVSFTVTATDEDSDELSYSWSVTNETITVTAPVFYWTFQNPGTFYVQVNVTDQVLTDSKMWTVNVEPSATDTNPVLLKTSLLPNYPNPFNPSTCISYQLEKSSHVNLEIFNSKGQLIKSLVNHAQQKGTYQIEWDGTDSLGQAVASGIYLYRLQAGTYQKINKMMLIK